MKKQSLKTLLYIFLISVVIFSLLNCSQNQNTVEHFPRFRIRWPFFRFFRYQPRFKHNNVAFNYDKVRNTGFGLFQPKYIQKLLDKIKKLDIPKDKKYADILNNGVLALAYRIQNEVDRTDEVKPLEREVNYHLYGFLPHMRANFDKDGFYFEALILRPLRAAKTNTVDKGATVLLERILGKNNGGKITGGMYANFDQSKQYYRGPIKAFTVKE